jgi:hypothetical protein
LRQVHVNSPLGPEATWGLNKREVLQNLAGYILEPPAIPASPAIFRAWGYVIVATGTLGEPPLGQAGPGQPSFNGVQPKPLQLRPVGRLLPVEALQRGPEMPMSAPLPKPAAPVEARQSEPVASPTVHTLRPVRSGQAYRIASPPVRGLVRPELAEALETVFERFARERGFTPEKPLEIRLTRGFQAGSHGHGEGRAADIAAVGGKSLLAWKQEWDRALATVEKPADPQQRAEAITVEQQRNLGYGLYKALQERGGWRVNPGGWRVYRGVMQLFGPWTATEGPWKAMQIKNPNPYQQQRLADQQWVFQAHQDHIHVAR